MRVTLPLLFVFLALSACKRSESQPTKVTPPAERHGFIQEHDGHRAVIVQHGDVTIAIPFDRVPTGTVFVKDGVTTAMPDGFTLPLVSPICPCCIRTCGSPCEPVAMPCEPLLPFMKELAARGRSLPQ